MTSRENLRFGIFMPPIHEPHENPTLCLDRDMAVIEHLDRFGFDEAWIGEHHSAGSELISCPELFIAAAAERTKAIRLGTGVASLPYHHPLMIADRWMMLHHMTRGRAMFGCGPGSLVSDAKMMGIVPEKQREMMEQSLSCVMRLIRGEVVTEKTEWFELNDARLQLKPYKNIMPDICTASMVSPSGPRAAGKNGTGLLSMGATAKVALAAAADNWALAEETATEYGFGMDRSRWRMMGMMHVAESREQAREEAEEGLRFFVDYFDTTGTLAMVPKERRHDCVGHMIESGLAAIGTPDDAIQQIEMLWQASGGGFGCYLIADLNWAPFERKLKSYELFARYVMPHFQNHNSQRIAARAWAQGRHDTFVAEHHRAVGLEFEKLAAHRERKASESVAAE
ncbi:MAG TPA: LLM class flavin-dependent oxidoreductase [Sphingomonas sp.]